MFYGVREFRRPSSTSNEYSLTSTRAQGRRINCCVLRCLGRLAGESLLLANILEGRRQANAAHKPSYFTMPVRFSKEFCFFTMFKIEVEILQRIAQASQNTWVPAFALAQRCLSKHCWQRKVLQPNGPDTVKHGSLYACLGRVIKFENIHWR